MILHTTRFIFALTFAVLLITLFWLSQKVKINESRVEELTMEQREAFVDAHPRRVFELDPVTKVKSSALPPPLSLSRSLFLNVVFFVSLSPPLFLLFFFSTVFLFFFFIYTSSESW